MRLRLQGLFIGGFGPQALGGDAVRRKTLRRKAFSRRFPVRAPALGGPLGRREVQRWATSFGARRRRLAETKRLAVVAPRGRQQRTDEAARRGRDVALDPGRKVHL